MRIFITGASGFIGQYLLNKLNEIGIYTIAYIRKNENPNLVMGKYITYVYGNTYEYHNIKRYSSECDCIIHLAGITSYYNIMSNLNEAFNNSIQGIINVLRACHENGISKLLFTSSGKVYKPCNIPKMINEDYETIPCTYMGKYKLEVERIINLYSEIYPNMSINILRMFNVFGYGQNEKFLIPRILSALSENKVYLCKDLSCRDYIYVKDVVNAIVTITFYNSKGKEIFNLGSGDCMTVYEIVDIIEKVSGKKVSAVYTSSENRLEGQYECADITKIMSLGYKQNYTFDHAIKDILFIKSNGLIS